MIRWIGLAVLSVALFSCQDGPQRETVSFDLQVFPAQLDADTTAAVSQGQSRVRFAGSHRSHAGVYLVSDQPLLTGWNITAVRVAEEPDGSRAISFRLNAAARKRLAEYAADEANLKIPLGVRVDERWADFSPMLRAPTDRFTLFGLTAEEATRLEAWMKVR